MAVVANKRSVMTLYSDPQHVDSHRVRMVMAEKNVTADILDVDDPACPPEDVVELNPYATLPTLIDRDLGVYDAQIAMEYLDERFPHPPLLPVDPVSRAKSRLLQHRINRDWYSLLHTITTGAKGAVKARKELREGIVAATPIFEAMPYFMSEELSLVDCSIAPLLWRLPSLEIEIPKSAKAILAYEKRVYGRATFQESLSELEKEMRP